MPSFETLSAEAVRTCCDPSVFSFASTAEVEPPEGIVGQARAAEAIRFGMEIRGVGYNLFARGPTGMGKHYFVRRFLSSKAASMPSASDWCYVENFKDPKKPRALRLLAGEGRRLCADLKQFATELKPALEIAFEGEKFRAQRSDIERHFRHERAQVLDGIKRRARGLNIVLVEVEQSMQLSFLKDNEPLNDDGFKALSVEEQDLLQSNMRKVYEMLQSELRCMPQWEREKRKQLKQLEEEIARAAIEPLIQELMKLYGSHSGVAEHLDTVADDVVDVVAQIVGDDGDDADGSSLFDRYGANLIVDNAESEGAPVLFEDRVGLGELVGRLEYRSTMGVMETDYSLIKPGALHRANGGYLIIEARRLLKDDEVWEALKRSLRSQSIRIDSGQQRSLSTESLEPDPIPLDVKVVLIGERSLYALLCDAEPEFTKFFKVLVDFEEDMPRDAAGVQAFAGLVATLIRKEGLLPLDPGAMGQVVEAAARDAEHAGKLSIHVQQLFDLLRESDFFASQAQREVVTRADVERALAASEYRAGRLRERIIEEVLEGVRHIRSTGCAVGQVNGLSVVRPGRVAFGKVGRITSTVRLGRGEVIDIEREVELGGPLHSKGILILAGYLGQRYCPQQPLALDARLVFEQSYGGIDGDSATAAEMCALLSALAEAPVFQRYAMTGSMDQYGRIQAVGGVNEKIEGFFELCQARGLDAEEEPPGVLLPRSNVAHLMLKPEVVEAVAAGSFCIAPIETVDQALEILCAHPVGERDAEGRFPEHSLNARIESRLERFAQTAQRWGRRE